MIKKKKKKHWNSDWNSQKEIESWYTLFYYMFNNVKIKYKEW